MWRKDCVKGQRKGLKEQHQKSAQEITARVNKCTVTGTLGLVLTRRHSANTSLKGEELISG